MCYHPEARHGQLGPTTKCHLYDQADQNGVVTDEFITILLQETHTVATRLVWSTLTVRAGPFVLDHGTLIVSPSSPSTRLQTMCLGF